MFAPDLLPEEAAALTAGFRAHRPLARCWQHRDAQAKVFSKSIRKLLFCF